MHDVIVEDIFFFFFFFTGSSFGQRSKPCKGIGRTSCAFCFSNDDEEVFFTIGISNKKTINEHIMIIHNRKK